MPNRILALDLEGSHLVAVLVETSFRSYRFVNQVAVARDVGRPLVEQLQEFLAANHLGADRVLTALPGRSASFRILDLPFRDRRKIEQTVPFEIESLVPIALEDSIVDFEVLSRGEAGARVFAALVPRKTLADHLSLLSEVGLDPAVVDFAPFCTLNTLQLFEGDRPDDYGFLHIGEDQATLALFRGNALGAFRVLDFSGASPGELLLQEVRWTFRALTGKEGDPQRLDGFPLLVAGSLPDGSLEELHSRLGLRVQRLEELPLRHIPPELRNAQGTFATAIGLALREIAEKPTVGLDFRREEFTYHRGQQEIRGTLARLGVLGAVALVLFLVSNLVSYRTLAARSDDLDTGVRKVFQATLPDEPTIIDATEQLSQAVDGLRQRARSGGDTASALEVLRELSMRVPTSPRMNASELTLDGGTVYLRAETTSFEAIEQIKRSLSGSPLFHGVEVRDPRSIPRGRVEFRLSASFGPERSR